MSLNLTHFGDNFIPIISVEQIIHTKKYPLCSDPTCPCQTPETPSVPICIGNGLLDLTCEDFVNGYQAGHLTFMTTYHAVILTDEELSTLLLEKLASQENSMRYHVGYIVGWIATLASKGQEGMPI